MVAHGRGKREDEDEDETAPVEPFDAPSPWEAAAVGGVESEEECEAAVAASEEEEVNPCGSPDPPAGEVELVAVGRAMAC